jgi:hypothetical protein
MPSRLDIRLVGRASVLSFTRVCLGLAIFLGFVRLRIMIPCIRYNMN